MSDFNPTPRDTLTLPEFVNAGEINIVETGNSFVDLAYSIPFLASDADAYITSILSKQFIIGFEPTFFQVPYIYSCCTNLINGNYTSSSTDNGTHVITTYKIPYEGELTEKTATIVTDFNKETNILFYEVPREFSYNSVDQASLAFIQLADGSFNGTLLIPSSFVSNVDSTEYQLTFTISIKDIISVDKANPSVDGCYNSINSTCCRNPTTRVITCYNNYPAVASVTTEGRPKAGGCNPQATENKCKPGNSCQPTGEPLSNGNPKYSCQPLKK
jgi:hypothetical protein